MIPTLLQTKLKIPPLQPNTVARARLYEKLNVALEGKLLLVAAAAGSGKSTLITEWIRTQTSPTAWISLDETDNDPEKFAAYLLAAFGSISEDIVAPLYPLIIQPQPPPLASLIALLINQLAEQSESFILVLDDYHLITEASIHSSLDFLLERLPAHLTIILISRTEPPLLLARLRARNQLTEVTEADLRFTQGEVADFLAQRMGLTLADSTIMALAERTEGWVAGLQFAALSLQKLTDPVAIDDFIRLLSGRDRHLTDYLLQEVLQHQSTAVQTFLLQTAILPRLQCELCAVVLNIDEVETVQAHLEAIERANLFLIPLDNERQWYRYHHLFAELLVDQLKRTHSPDVIKTLHQRASFWFESAELMDEAIDHALAGEDFVHAARLIELTLPDTLWAQFALPRLRRWLSTFPEALLPDFPKLAVTGALVYLMAHDGPRMAPFMQALEEIPELPGEVAAKASMLRSVLLRTQDKIGEATELIEKTLANLPKSVSSFTHILLLAERSQLYWQTEDIVAQQRCSFEIRELAYRTGNHTFFVEATLWTGSIEKSQANLRRAEAHYREGLTLAHQYGGPLYPPAGRAHLLLGDLYYEWNDLTQALHHYEQGIEIGERIGMGDYLWWGYENCARLYYAQGHIDNGNLALETLREFVQQGDYTDLDVNLLEGFSGTEVEFALLRGDLEPVARWIEAKALTIDTLPNKTSGQHWLVADYWIAKSQQKNDPSLLPPVVRLLQHLITMADDRGYVERAIRLRLMLVQAYQGSGAIENAVVTLEQALLQAEPGGYIRMFVDRGLVIGQVLRTLRQRVTLPEAISNYVARLLIALDDDLREKQSPQTKKPLSEHTQRYQKDVSTPLPHHQSLLAPLTPREYEVLHLVVDGLSNQEIADQLIISLATVKRHVYNIYGKLDVKHRAQAAARARELNLV